MKTPSRLLMIVAITALAAFGAIAKDRTLDESKVDSRRKPAPSAQQEAVAQSRSVEQPTAVVSPEPIPAELAGTSPVAAEQVEAPMAGEQISWWVIGGGGGSGSSASFQLSGTIGQTAVGYVSSPGYGLNQGYWQDFSGASSGCCVGTTGNVNGDVVGSIDLSDLIFLVNFLFLGGPTPVCYASANVNGDPGCNVDLSDLIYFVNYLFLGGSNPALCNPGC
jgi:hypothetical protein